MEYINEEESDKFEDKLKKAKKQLKRAQKEAKENLDGWQRERADFANYKKDIQNYIDNSREAIKEDAISNFLAVLDNFYLMAGHVPQDVEKTNWYKGMQQIEKQIESVLKNLGVEEISAKKGDKFDPQLHEAQEGEGENIEKIIQKGYKMGDKIIRPVKVKVN